MKDPVFYFKIVGKFSKLNSIFFALLIFTSKFTTSEAMEWGPEGQCFRVLNYLDVSIFHTFQ